MMASGPHGELFKAAAVRQRKACGYPTKATFLCLLSFVYLLIGGAIFSALELDAEREAQLEYDQAIADAFSSAALNSTQKTTIMQLLDTLDEKRGAIITVGVDDWTFVRSVHYSITVVTTIGYGSLSPTTVEGQAVTVVYAIIGIPFVFFVFAFLGRKIMESMGNLILAIKKLMGGKVLVNDRERILAPLFVAIVLVASLLSAGAAVFLNTEDWTYWESFYFSFVTMTTIGLGDFVPTYNDNFGTLLAHFLYTFLLLSLYSYLINVALTVMERVMSILSSSVRQAMDIDGNGAVGFDEIWFFLTGRINQKRLEFQDSLLRGILSNTDLDSKTRVLEEWGQFSAVFHATRNKIPSGVELIFLTGGPCSGRTTQAQMLCDKYNLVNIALDELIQAEVESGSLRGQALVEFLMTPGAVVPKEILAALFKDRLSKLQKGDRCVVSGFPLDRKQAIYFETNVRFAEYVFYLECSDDELRTRFRLRGRRDSFLAQLGGDQSIQDLPDDSLEFKSKLEAFKEARAGLLEYFEEDGRLYTVGGEGTQEEVFARLLEALDRAEGGEASVMRPRTNTFSGGYRPSSKSPIMRHLRRRLRGSPNARNKRKATQKGSKVSPHGDKFLHHSRSASHLQQPQHQVQKRPSDPGLGSFVPSRSPSDPGFSTHDAPAPLGTPSGSPQHRPAASSPLAASVVTAARVNSDSALLPLAQPDAPADPVDQPRAARPISQISTDSVTIRIHPPDDRHAGSHENTDDFDVRGFVP